MTPARWLRLLCSSAVVGFAWSRLWEWIDQLVWKTEDA